MIVAFAGLKGSGKDTAANLLVEEYGFTKVAFADPVREMALIIDPIIPVKYNYGREDREVDVYPVMERLSDLVSAFGWDRIKREIPEVRRFLQKLATEAVRDMINPHVWINILEERFPDIAEESSRYVISDCRFTNEVAFILANEGVVCWLTRSDIKSDGHASETDEVLTHAQCWIRNDSTVEDFLEKIREFVEAEGFSRE